MFSCVSLKTIVLLDMEDSEGVVTPVRRVKFAGFMRRARHFRLYKRWIKQTSVNLVFRKIVSPQYPIVATESPVGA